MRTHCRCRTCRTRTTLRMPPAHYVKPPLCKCGGVLRLDQDANGRPWRKKPMCHCDGVWFSIKASPHRRGGGLCVYNEKLYLEPQDG